MRASVSSVIVVLCGVLFVWVSGLLVVRIYSVLIFGWLVVCFVLFVAYVFVFWMCVSCVESVRFGRGSSFGGFG